MRFQKIINPAFDENFSCLSHWEVWNPHPLYNLGWSWTSPLKFKYLCRIAFKFLENIEWRSQINFMDFVTISYLTRNWIYNEKGVSGVQCETMGLVLKSRFCEEAAKFYEITTLDLTVCNIVKSKVEISQTLSHRHELNTKFYLNLKISIEFWIPFFMTRQKQKHGCWLNHLLV